MTSTIQIDSLSISPYYFNVFDAQNTRIEPSQYSIDFSTATLTIDPQRFQTITVHYKALPLFLTKDYSAIDQRVIIDKPTDLSRLYRVQEKRTRNDYMPFSGLQTAGSISRGITVGSNQDAVVNSNFDLQIAGNLSKDIKIRAAITDTNVPMQEQGYSQRLEEFDQVYVEMFTDRWKVQAGDINLQETEHSFLRFNKKVAGIKIDAHSADERWNYAASGALVRGQFSRSEFNGQEGNQGPYKLNGANGAQFMIIISGSETVYVNGQQVQRGENNAYTIDYTTAELTFNPTFPITGQMRIVVEYQFSKRNYTRFVSHDGISYKGDDLQIGLSFYNENDLKNSPVQQDLNVDQKEVLAMAGDDESKMIISSAVPTVFEEHKILYKKETIGGITIYQYTTDPNDEVFNVTFSYVGENAGSYQVENTIASGRIYNYVGLGNGAYEPILPLIAPNSLQIVALNTAYSPTDRMNLSANVALSNRDLNLFSTLNDSDNQGLATEFEWAQTLVDKSWQLKSQVHFEWIDQDFNTVERFRPVEFFRDWDLVNPFGNQQKITGGLRWKHPEKGLVHYAFDQLKYTQNYTGRRHQFDTNLKLNRTELKAKVELVKSENSQFETEFNRWDGRVKHLLQKSWVGIGLQGEQRERQQIQSGRLDSMSHHFTSGDLYYGIGDTAKVFAEVGLSLSQTDSVYQQSIMKVNHAKTFYFRSKLLQSTQANLFLYANYRTVDARFSQDEEQLNARVNYSQIFANNAVKWQTSYETSSGSLPRQSYSYIEVDTGQGYYTWVDYNENGIQELEEFEQAQFQDQANYLRVLLPSTERVKTNENKFSQSLLIHPSQWVTHTGVKKTMAKFTNQTTVQINSKRLRTNGFNLNPFAIHGDAVLSLQTLYKNSLYFNRGQQHYSTTYTYLNSRNKSTFATGDQDFSSVQHRVKFEHKLGAFWLLANRMSLGKSAATSVGFASRNYHLDLREIRPSLAYILNAHTRFEGAYSIKHKENTINGMEQYDNQTVSLDIQYRTAKGFGFNTTLNYIDNKFVGNANSPVAYQLLEGLRPGVNFTWHAGIQQKLTQYLDFNLVYTGRKSAKLNAIHTGSIQLRANF
ncbi:hypothetical protein MWU59_05340 [Flavobacteriaceae bacterium F08102]|nr:hypothetical protein [Flavobacteriaceae bacterium F08102]